MTSDTGSPATTIGSIAALLQAVAWPIVVLLLLGMYKSKVRILVDIICEKLKEAKHVKAGQFEIDTELAITQAMNRTAEQASTQKMGNEVPKDQIQAAILVDERLNASPIAFSQKLDVVHKQLYSLVDQYETVRREQASGPARTRLMNEIAAKMRAISIIAYPFLPPLMAGKRAGERLAAICIMQVKPEIGYFDWLIERIMEEDQPFVFFHASLAILESVKAHSYLRPKIAADLIRRGIERLESFRGGKPDTNTIEVLNHALAILENKSPQDQA
jgi:hypothetical protein